MQGPGWPCEHTRDSSPDQTQTNSPINRTFPLSVNPGFVMAYGYARSNKPIDVSEFLIKRWANLYPLYLVTVVAGMRCVSLCFHSATHA